jgi:hypothetical protein
MDLVGQDVQLIATYYNTRRRCREARVRHYSFEAKRMIIVLGILWFVLSFVVANAASQRGRGKYDWFALSILTSPILAALFLLLFPPIHHQGGAYSVDDQRLYAAIEIDEPYRGTGRGASIAVRATIFVTLVGLGGLFIVAKSGQPELPRNDVSTASRAVPLTKSYETVAQLTCMDLLNALDTARLSEIVDPVIEFVGQHNDLGTPVNATSYLLTECRLHEGQTIAKALDNLFEQKRTGRLPQIPIGGATSDAYVRAIWIPFDKWVRHQGPRPNFSKAGGF